METQTEFIDEIYEYKGLWNRSSKCGIKIIQKMDRSIVIATELYDSNPGTSVNNWSAKLAFEICQKKSIDPGKLIFIEHNPDMGSRLSFYEQAFYKVTFQVFDDRFENPTWEKISKEAVVKLIIAEV